MKCTATLTLATCIALSACTSKQSSDDELDAIVADTKQSADEARALAQQSSANAASAQPVEPGPAEAAPGPSVSGWPTEACNFLPALATRGYKNDFDDEYGCSSPYKEIGAPGRAGLSNNLAYYGYGKAQTVEKLKLVVNYNAPGDPKEATRQLVEQATLLSQKAANVALPASIEKALRDGASTSTDAGGVHHEVKREDWPTGIGYEVHYTLTKSP